jgi:hypothetical protein
MTIKETGTVEFKVGATDPDGDFVRYYFSSPLGKRNGKWSTDYGDKGNYTIWVTATDGRSETTQKLQLEVLKNDRAPSLSVPDDSLTINEGQNLSFAVKATDPDKDNLTISIGNLPKSASFKEGNFQWTPGYDTVKNMTLGWWNNFISRSSFWNKRFSPDKNVLWLSFIASDGVVETVHPVKVTIKNVNRAPELLDYTPTDAEITTKVNQPVIFHVTVKDQDYDPLQYNWDFGFVGGTASGTDTVQRSYTTAGTKNVKVTVSDGRAEVEKQWEVKVEAEEAVAEETNAPNAVPQPAPEPVTESTTEKPSIKVYVING